MEISQSPSEYQQSCNSLGQQRFSALIQFVLHINEARISPRPISNSNQSKMNNFRTFSHSRYVEANVRSRFENKRKLSEEKFCFAGLYKIQDFRTTLYRFLQLKGGVIWLITTSPGAFFGMLKLLMHDCIMLWDRCIGFSRCVLITATLKAFLFTWACHDSFCATYGGWSIW